LGHYLNNYQGAKLVASGEYQKAQEFFSGASKYNFSLVPFVASLRSPQLQQVFTTLSTPGIHKGGDNPAASVESQIDSLEAHLEIVQQTLEALSGQFQKDIGDRYVGETYQNLFKWKVYVSALACSLYLQDYAQKLSLNLDVAQKAKKVLDEMIAKLGDIKNLDPQQQACIEEFKQSLIKTRESFFLLEQILEGFLAKISNQVEDVIEDPLGCLEYQINIKDEMRDNIRQLSSQLSKLSTAILEASKKLDNLIKAQQLNCKSLENLQ